MTSAILELVGSIGATLLPRQPEVNDSGVPNFRIASKYCVYAISRVTDDAHTSDTVVRNRWRPGSLPDDSSIW
jgi:hypothetical protein